MNRIWARLITMLLLFLATGAVQIASAQDTFIINEGIGGNWFNPDHNGQGFVLEVVPGATPQLIIAWFTFDASGDRQMWLYGVGPISDQDTATVELVIPEGGVFDDPAAVDMPVWGFATIQFSSCTEAMLTYESPDEGLAGEIQLVRLTPDQLCRSIDVNGSNFYRGAGNYSIKSSNTRIATTLALPSGAGPHPSVVLVHGSGQAVRSNLQWLSDLLTQRGFAVMTYDKRGVGESEGFFIEAGNRGSRLQVLGNDVVQMLRLLRHHEDIDKGQLGILGISQGGWINPIVATRFNELAFIVNIVGTTVSIGEEIFYSQFTDSGQSIEQATLAMSGFTGMHGYNPIPDWQVIEVPSLWVLGGLDRSIPTSVTIDRLQPLINAGKPYTIQLYPQGNHGLRDPQGNVIPYITPAGGVIDWIRDQLTGSDS